MKITIPNHKAKSRNTTSYSHWRVYQKHRDEVAELVFGYIKHRKTFQKPVKVELRAYYKGKRSIDTSNLDDKVYLDSLIKNNIIKDDTAKLNPVVIKKVIPQSKENKVEILIKELNDK